MIWLCVLAGGVKSMRDRSFTLVEMNADCLGDVVATDDVASGGLTIAR